MLVLPGYIIDQEISRHDGVRVYRGRTAWRGTPVIIKAPDEDSPDEAAAGRLMHEYEVARSLDVDGVVKPLYLERAGSRVAIVIEDTGAVSLRNHLRGEAVDLPRFFSIASQVVRIVGQIHDRGVVHRDLRPENIIIDPASGRVRITGFSRAARMLPGAETAPAAVAPGSPAYMAPEQTGCLERAADHRSDLYSLGVIMFEMLTGRLPLEARDPAGWVYALVARRPESPGESSPGIPPAVSAMVMKLLSKNPEDRYQGAYGLLWDLEECRRRLSEAGAIEPFPLGARDVPARLRLPRRLFGRRRESDALAAAFAAVCGGNGGVMLVRGFAGVGKTKLVNEVLRPLALKKGFFVAGKFDQVHQDIPYAAFAQAFGNLVRQIMTENQDRLNAWRKRISEAVGRSGGIVAAVVPELELVVGQQPPVEVLQPKEAQNRFLMVFESFIGAFAGREHPLVVFLDDLQWADPASLHLIRYLCRGSENRYWLLVVAYRDNEISETHPLADALRDIRSAGMTVREVEVSPLGQPEVREYIDGALHSHAEDLGQLSEVLYRKSGGNPLFLGQLAQTIYHDGLVRFSIERGRWEWDLAAIRRSPVADSILDFLIGRLQKLPVATRDVLKLAACLGNRFDLRTLSVVCEMPVDEAAACLLPALEAGLLLPAGLAGDSRPEAEAEPGYDENEFVHDRVQQAAYAMVPDEEKGAVHLRIGRLMLRSAGRDTPDDVLLPMMDHFNRGLELVNDPAEKLRLSELNLAAGRKAKGAAAYDSALRYFRAGMALLPQDSWENQYELSYHLCFECAQCEYMSGNMETAERLFDEIVSRTRTEIERASVHASRVMLHAGMGDYRRAIRIGVGALQRLGIRLPLKPGNLDYARELLLYRWFMLRRKPEDLERLPEMSDPVQRKAAELLIRLACVACVGDSRLYGLVILKAANQAVRYGNSEMACIGYIGYSITAGSVLGDYAAGERFARVCMNLAERYGSNSTRAVVYFTVGAIVSHWTQHGSVGLRYLREAVRCGLEAGEVPVLGYAIGFIFENMYLMGTPLRDVLEETERAEAWARRMKHLNLAANVAMYRRVVSGLLGRRAAPDTDSAPAENDEAVRATRCFLRMQSCFLRGDYRGAAAAAREIDGYAEVLMGFLISADCVLYQSLALAAVYGESSPAERKRCWCILKRNRRRMKKWADACTTNFLHKYALIDAEMARLRGRVEDAMTLYDRSIQSAHDNGYAQSEGIASELAGRCCVEAGRRRIAAMYLENARAAYRRWGSPVKVKDLEERYPDLLAASRDVEIEAEEPGALAGVIAGIAAKAGGSSDEIDTKVVERAVRSLGRETDPDRLVEGLLEVAVESAGADRGYLILERDGELFIEAAKEGAQRSATVVPPVHLEKSMSLCRAMVRYSARTLEPVIVNDRRDAGIFARDPYVAKNYPKSMMCLPVLFSRIPVGVLYLENSLMTGAFTQARVEVLKLLLSQMVYVRTLQVYLEGSTSGSEGEGRAALIEPLTERESEVLSLVAAGLSNGEIAEKLGMTVNTVKTHMKNIYGKLQVNRRVQAVARGRELGVL